MAAAGELLGYTAATLTTLCFVPQVLHTWRTRDVAGVSLGMYALFTLGVGFWLAYGLWLKAWPMIIANSIIWNKGSPYKTKNYLQSPEGGCR